MQEATAAESTVQLPQPTIDTGMQGATAADSTSPLPQPTTGNQNSAMTLS